MSYCRWSSVCDNNFESDLYIYDHVEGHISVNIAGARLAGIENAPRKLENLTPQAYGELYLARQQWRKDNADTLKHVPIGLPHAGQSRAFTSARECVAFLRELKELGYHMPAYVLEEETYERAE